MKSLTLGAVLLGCCLVATAQTNSPQNPSNTVPTPSTPSPSAFPPNSAGGGRTPSPSAMPGSSTASPDVNQAPGSMANDQATSAQATMEGCLSQSSDGTFTLSDNSGTSYQLRGEASQLSDNVGKEVRINGTILNSSASTAAGAMSSRNPETPTPGASSKQFVVSRVEKIADTCSAAAK